MDRLLKQVLKKLKSFSPLIFSCRVYAIINPLIDITDKIFEFGSFQSSLKLFFNAEKYSDNFFAQNSTYSFIVF